MLATTAAFISETFKAKEIRKCQFKPEAERTHVMGLFNNLMSKIFSHPTATGRSASQTAAAAPIAGGAQQPQGGTTPASSSAAAPSRPTVDVAAVLNDIAKKNPEKLDWRGSIVDLMKLVGMDSGLAARKKLATELHYAGDLKDSASMNVWLHKEVLKKLAENGGKVPQELLT
jgi:Domain of unknown function (DUF3597)